MWIFPLLAYLCLIGTLAIFVDLCCAIGLLLAMFVYWAASWFAPIVLSVLVFAIFLDAAWYNAMTQRRGRVANLRNWFKKEFEPTHPVFAQRIMGIINITSTISRLPGVSWLCETPRRQLDRFGWTRGRDRIAQYLYSLEPASEARERKKNFPTPERGTDNL